MTEPADDKAWHEWRREGLGGSCSVDDCNRPIKCKGLCAMHYKRMRETGSVGQAGSAFRTSCSVVGCSGRHRANGLCELHYSRLRRLGSVDKPPTYSTEMVDAVRRLYDSGMSQVEVGLELGVTQKVIARLMSVHGLAARPRIKRNQRGANNSVWNPSTANYKTLHSRVSAARGRPKRCEECGTADPARMYHWANLTGDYVNVNDYRRMCVPCHRAYDDSRRIRKAA
jgi:predicted transcriptional regulator